MEVDGKIIQIHEKIDEITAKIKVLDMEITEIEIEKELTPARAQKNMPVSNRLSEQWINLMTESTLLSKERNDFLKELSDAWTLKIENERKIREQKRKSTSVQCDIVQYWPMCMMCSTWGWFALLSDTLEVEKEKEVEVEVEVKKDDFSDRQDSDHISQPISLSLEKAPFESEKCENESLGLRKRKTVSL